MYNVQKDLLEKSFTTTPRNIDSHILKFCHEISPNHQPCFLSIDQSKGFPPNECFYNVRKQIDRDGGTIIFGWKIWVWRNVFIEAEYHAVWEIEGHMNDITPNVSGETTILFLPDPKCHFDYTNMKRKLNIRRALANIVEVQRFITAADALYAFMERNSEGRQIRCDVFELERYQYKLHLASQELLIRLWQDTKPNDPCFCGRTQKFKKCCYPLIELHS